MKKEKREKVISSILIILLVITFIGIGYIMTLNYLDAKKNKPEEEEHHDIFDDFETNTEDFKLEGKKGTNFAFITKRLIEDIVELNENGRNIVVIFNDKEYKNEEIENIKTLINDNYSYNVKFEYKDKLICKAIIKREITSHDLSDHNTKFEHLYTGTISGSSVKSVIDEIIRINDESEYKVVFNYNNKDITDSKELRKLKSNFDIFTNYEVYYEKDSIGFINKAIVERVK